MPIDQAITDSSDSCNPSTFSNLEEMLRRPRGKHLNAYRHGLTGQIMVLLPEEQEAYKALCTSLKTAYDPKGAIEENLVQSICDAEWRLKRVVSYENSLFAMKASPFRNQDLIDTGNVEVDVAFAQARTFLDRARDFSLLSTYEGRIHRRLQRDMATLQQLQATRRAQAEAAMETAKQLYKLAKAQAKPYKPEAFFKRDPNQSTDYDFVFSSASVLHEIHRQTLLETAREFARTGVLPHPEGVPAPEQEAA